MIKRLLKLLRWDGLAPFEGYYQNVLAMGPPAPPRADEARRDFRDALRQGLTGLV